jgi:hypothetical protein
MEVQMPSESGERRFDWKSRVGLFAALLIALVVCSAVNTGYHEYRMSGSVLTGLLNGVGIVVALCGYLWLVVRDWKREKRAE